MFELKRLSPEAIPAALEKALRYRLLNEPAEAESICHDVLTIDPENQEALVMLLLAITDRFGKGYGVGVTEAQHVMSAPTMLELFVSAARKRSFSKVIPAPAMTRTNSCVKP
jgi:hypothetical protein